MMKLVLKPNTTVKRVVRLNESQFKKLIRTLSESEFDRKVLDPQGEDNEPLKYSPGIGTDPDGLEADDMWNNLISDEDYVEDPRTPEEKYEDFVRDHQTARNAEHLKRDDREYFEPKNRMPVPLPNDSKDWERPEFDEFEQHMNKQLQYGDPPEDDIDHPGFNRTPWKKTTTG